MNNKGLSHTLKDHTLFFITVTKKFIIQITWNTVPYQWHALPAVNYGKLLVLFVFKIFTAPTSPFFFFWFDPDDSLRESNNTVTAPFHLLILLMSMWDIKEKVFPKKIILTE